MQYEKQTVEQVDYSAYTKDYPVEERTNDYYWNIDTSGFDKNMFDGTFSVFGYDFNGKVTGSTLQANGFEIESDGYTKSLYWDEEDFYSDSSEVEYYCCQTDVTYADAIIPKCLITDNNSTLYKTLSIDAVIEHLGVPTYVKGRTDSSADDLGHFEYLYVYDDYVLNFAFMYTEATGIVHTGYTYDGMTIFDQPCKFYDMETDEATKYDSPFEYLEEHQAEYLETIK